MIQKLAKNGKSIIGEYWQYIPVVVSALLLGSSFLFTGKVLFWGTVILQFIPWRHYAWTVIQSGHFPLWNPLAGMGAPLLANYQSALFYPPNWLLFILDALGGVSWLAWGQGVLVVFHWCLAGVGMICFLKWLGIGKLGQAVGGVCFGLSSYIVGRSSFLSINAAVAWMPWIILYCSILVHDILLVNKPKRGNLIGLAILFVLQLLSGHAQTTWYTIVLAFAWSGFLGYVLNWARESSSKTKKPIIMVGKIWLWITASLLIAVIITAVQLFPTFEYLLQSQRSTAVNLEQAMTYSFWPWRFITLFAPGMYGNPALGDYWGYGNYWEDALYIGLLPIILALWILIGGWTKSVYVEHEKTQNISKPIILFMAILIFISMLLALGDRTPVYPWLYKSIPTFDMFQAPTRISIWAIFAISILGSIGIDRVKRPVKRALYWMRLSTAGAFAITLGAGLVLIIIEDIAPTFIRAFAIMGLFGIISGLLVLYSPKREENGEQIANSSIVWTFGILIFICGDLIYSNWGLNPVVDRSVIDQISKPSKEQFNLERVYISVEDEYALKFDQFMRFDTFNPTVGWDKLPLVQIPNMAMLKGIPSANNFDPLLPSSYAQWQDELVKQMESGNQVIITNLLNLMGVGSVEELNLSSVALVQYRQLKNPQRLRLINCAIAAEDNEHALKLIIDNQININDDIVIEGLNKDQTKNCLSSNTINGKKDAIIVEENPNFMAIQTQSSEPMWLFLADVWYPGWVATIDGVETPVYRANSLFRAVELKSGNHLVEFFYRPLSFYSGLIISFISCAFLIFFMVYPWKKQTI